MRDITIRRSSGKNCKTHYGNACKSECGSELFGSPGIEATAHTKRKTFSLSSIKNGDFFGFFQYFAKPRLSGYNIDAEPIWLAPGDQSQTDPESGSTTKTGRRILDIQFLQNVVGPAKFVRQEEYIPDVN